MRNSFDIIKDGDIVEMLDERKKRNSLLSGTMLDSQYLVVDLLDYDGVEFTYIGLNIINSQQVVIKEFFPSDYVIRKSENSDDALIIDGIDKVQYDNNKEKLIQLLEDFADAETDLYSCFVENNTLYIILDYKEKYANDFLIYRINDNDQFDINRVLFKENESDKDNGEYLDGKIQAEGRVISEESLEKEGTPVNIPTINIPEIDIRDEHADFAGMGEVKKTESIFVKVTDKKDNESESEYKRDGDLNNVNRQIKEECKENDTNPIEGRKNGGKSKTNNKADKVKKDKKRSNKDGVVRKMLLYVMILVIAVCTIIVVCIIASKMILGGSGNAKNANEEDNIIEDQTDAVTIVEEIVRDDAYFEEIFNNSGNASNGKLLFQQTDDFEGNKENTSIIFFGDEIQENNNIFYRGTAWYVNDNGVTQIAEGDFQNLGEIVNINNKSFIFLDYYESENDISAVYKFENGVPVKSAISGLGNLERVDNDTVVLISRKSDNYYNLETDDFAGESTKEYYFYFDDSTNDFKEYFATDIDEEKIYDICDIDLVFETEKRGNNVINCIERGNGIITINYYRVEEEKVIFDQVNWDENSNRYLVANSKTEGDEFDKSGYGGIYLKSISDGLEYQDFFKEIKEQLDNNYTFRGKRIVEGSLVNFGVYEQDYNYQNGDEDIVWRVLDINDDKALLFSEDVLDYEKFHDFDTTVVWENSRCRQFLMIFYEIAFSPADKAVIIPTQRESAMDNVFLLSVFETRLLPSKENEYDYNVSVLSKATDYAVKFKGAKVFDEEGHCRWWTCSSTGSAGEIGVWSRGEEDRLLLPSTGAGIRPAVWVKLD